MYDTKGVFLRVDFLQFVHVVPSFRSFFDKTARRELARSPRCAVRWPLPPGRAPPSGVARGSGVARRLPDSRVGFAVARAWHARPVAPTTAAPRGKAKARRISGAWNRGRTNPRRRRRRVRAPGGTTPGKIPGPSGARARHAARGPTSAWMITASPSTGRKRAGLPSGMKSAMKSAGTRTRTGTRTLPGTLLLRSGSRSPARRARR